MKQRVAKAICLSAVVLFLLTAVTAFAEDRTVNLESIVVQSFDNPDEQPWFVIGSKFATAGYPKLAYVNQWPLSLHGSNPRNRDQLRALGLATLFDRREYNWVDIIPGTKSGEGANVSYAPIEIPLPGRVSMIDLWVWSGNYDYYLEAYVRDFKGIVHTIPMGNLTHVGWRNFRANIPSSIPQSKKYLPRTERLTFVKFRLWTRPTEIVAAPVRADAPDHEKAIYFYFDHFKVLTDTFESLFDGDSLTDPEFLKDTWASGTTN